MKAMAFEQLKRVFTELCAVALSNVGPCESCISRVPELTVSCLNLFAFDKSESFRVQRGESSYYNLDREHNTTDKLAK